MENKTEHDLRLLQLRFIGKILASFTHEIKNHIAIIKESAGLMEDMIKLKQSSNKNEDEYIEIIHSIEEQVEKTNNLFRYLNRFSHRMDTVLSSFNVNESLEELSALLNRFANQKKIVIEKFFQDDIPSIQNNPAILQFLVFHLFMQKMARLDRNSRISIKTEYLNESITIRIITKGTPVNVEKEEEELPHHVQAYILEQIGGSISGENEDVKITLPLRL
ncbi:MAG: hypothetical protein AB1610_04045 [Nitrospirota bacterium]